MIYWLLNIFLLAVLTAAWYRSLRDEYRATFLPGLAARLVAGIGVGLLYTFYYPAGDTFSLFDQATQLTELSRQDPSRFFDFMMNGSSQLGLEANQPRSIFFVSILAFINFGTGSNYWLDALWLSYFSFAGSWYLVRSVVRIYPDTRMIASLSFLFFPSVLLWGSGIMKESIALGGLCFLAGIFISAIRKESIRMIDWGILLLSLFVLLNLKYYWAAVFIPATLASLLLNRWTNHQGWSGVKLAAIWSLVFVSICLLGPFLHPNFYFENFLGVIKDNHDTFIRFAPSSLYIQYYDLTASWWSLLINSPWALISGIFRPFLFEARTLPHVFSGVENLILLVLFVFQLSKIKWPPPEDRLLFLSAIAYIVVLCIFLALSTPNFGTLSRYRVGFLPFLVFVLMMNSDVLRGRSFRKIISRMSHLG